VRYRRPFKIWALTAFGVHTALALLTFAAVWAMGHGQAGFTWMYLLIADFPTVWPTMELIGDSEAIRAIFRPLDQAAIGLGSNVMFLVIVVFFGGIQWFLIGGMLGVTICFMRDRIRLYRQPSV